MKKSSITESTKNHHKFFESNAGDGTTVYEQYLEGVPLYMCLLACFITLFLISLDQTIVMPILETIGTKFNAFNNIGWISSGYLLSMTVFAATWGKISILFGRKGSLIVAIILFEAGSLMCALAPDMNVLIGGRVLAGVGSGGVQSLTFIIGSELVPINKRALVFMCFGFTFAVASIIAPIIGGALAQDVTWRWCFYINLPLGGAAILALIFFFNPPSPKGSFIEKCLGLDYIGTLFLTIGLVLFLLSLSFGGDEFAWNSGAVISCFILGGLFIIIFCVWNFKYSTAPVIPYEIITVPQVDLPVIALGTTFFCFLSACIYITAYFQIVIGHGALKSGIDLLPAIGELIVGNISTAILISKTRRIKPFAIFGGVLGCIGFGLTTTLQDDTKPSTRYGYLVLPGYFLGTLLQSSVMACQLSAPKTDGSTIITTSLFNFSRSLGGAIGSDLSQVVYNACAKKKIRQALLDSPDLFQNYTVEDVLSVISSPQLIANFNGEEKPLILQAVMDSIRNVFYMVLGFTCLTFVLTLFYSNKMIPKKEEIQTKEEYEIFISNINDYNLSNNDDNNINDITNNTGNQ